MTFCYNFFYLSFIASLGRFVSRHGLPESITSDNGTNFKGAANELERLSTNNRLEYLILPSLPHFGGLWEAAMKSTKYHLKRVVGKAVLPQEQLFPILAKIEACLNSRPLYEPSDDPKDGSPLTLGHFLIGRPLESILQPTIPTITDHRNWANSANREVVLGSVV